MSKNNTTSVVASVAIAIAITLITTVANAVSNKSPPLSTYSTYTPLSNNNLFVSLSNEFKVQYKNKEELKKLQQKVLSYGPKAVPILAAVMKNESYPDPNRWLATFLLGRIMGKKGSTFIAKFLEHPNWVLRTASLKTLLALKEDLYQDKFASMLVDNSLIVRIQALENIRLLNLVNQAPAVWSMLYRKQNYNLVKGKLKRTAIIKNVIKTVGDLGHQKVRDQLFSMIKKNNYSDIFDELDYSLSKITGESSPKGTQNIKKIFWERMALREQTL